MGNQTSGKQIDNREWVKAHASQLVTTDPQSTFQYVATHHPYSGCARFPMPNLSGTESIQDLAALADAVCVACVEVLGFQTLSFEDVLDQVNTTAIANCAYIAQFHSDTTVRFQYLSLVDKWRSSKVPAAHF